MTSIGVADPRAARLVAERILAAAWGGPVRLDVGTYLRDNDHVQRCRVLEGPRGVPASVVVKWGFDDPRYAFLFFDEWAGLRFVGDVIRDEPVAPRLYGGDAPRRVLVLEDLGQVDDVEAALLGDDPAAAEVLLVGFWSTLGRLHAGTCGRAVDFAAVRAALGLPAQPRDTSGYTVLGPPLVEAPDPPYGWLAPALYNVAALGVAPAPGIADELAALRAALLDPGPFLAYTHGDPCLSNALRVGSTVRLIDFEVGAPRHALVDGVFGRMLFPTESTVYRLPPPTLHRMEAAYRAALVPGCPAAADDAQYARAIAVGCAFWALVVCRWYDLPGLLREDRVWGTATLRQRVLLRLDAAARAAEAGDFPALGATFAAIAARLRALWPPEVDELALYPAFRYSSSP